MCVHPTIEKTGVNPSTGTSPPMKENVGLPVHERDLKTQGAVLDLLLITGPDVMTAKELEAALADEVTLAGEGAIGWAVEDITGMGLLERDGTPTSRRRSTNTATPTRRPTGKLPRGRRPGGQRRLRSSSRYRGWYHTAGQPPTSGVHAWLPERPSVACDCLPDRPGTHRVQQGRGPDAERLRRHAAGVRPSRMNSALRSPGPTA